MYIYPDTRRFIFIFIMMVLALTACTNEQNAPDSPVVNHKELAAQYADTEFTVTGINEQSYDNKPALSIQLSIPVAPDSEFQNYLKVTHKQGEIVDGNWIVSAHGKQLFFPGIEPNRDYIVTVFKGLSAFNAKKLTDIRQETVHTQQLPDFVDFASKGSLIPADLVKGLPVVVTNITQVDVDFFRIKADKISQFLGDWGGQSSNMSGWRIDEYKPYTDLAYSGRFDLNPPKNARYLTHLDIHAIKALQQPGVYLAVMKAAGQYSDYQVTYFTVTDIGIHVRHLSNQLTVYTSSLATGAALEGVNLSFLDERGRIVEQLVSDDQGFAQLTDNLNRAKVLVAQKDRHLSVLKLKHAALDLSEFNSDGRSYNPLELFIYGPRSLYRPGETVSLSALLRDADGNAVATPPLNAVIKRPDGQNLKYFTWQADETGLYHYDFELPQQAHSGQWILQVSTPGAKDFKYTFAVEDFMPEHMALELGNAEDSLWVIADGALSVPVSGRYLYGAPAAGNRLDNQVYLQADRQPVKPFKDFYFGDVDEPIPYSDGAGFKLETLELDENGAGTVPFPTLWQTLKSTPVTIKLVSSLYETGGRAINRTIQYTYWPQKALIGVRPITNLDNLGANALVEFEFINSRHDGTRVNAEITLTLTHEQRDYYWQYSDNEGWQQAYTENNTPVATQHLTLTTDTLQTIKLPLQQGQYLLTLKNQATGQTTSLRFSAGHRWGEATEQSAKPDQVVLQWDKKAYLPGDTAHLKIIPPHPGQGFVTLENSEQTLWFKRLSVPATGLSVDIPIASTWNRHDIYASSVIFRSGDAKQTITPNRAIGLVHLPLERSQNALHLSIQTETTNIRPETTLTTHVKLNNTKPEETVYVTLAAVDTGVLSVNNFKTPDPWQWYFAQRRYAVDQHDVYGHIIEVLDAGLTPARFGGDGDDNSNGGLPRTHVKIVSLFTGPVKLNEQGEADIALDIPDFNGQLRLMVLAYSKNRFGTAESLVTVAAPIIAEAALPRFLAGGDQALMTLELLNQSGVEQTLDYTLNGIGPVKLDIKAQTLVLANQEKKILHFPILADHAFDTAELNFHLRNRRSGDEAIELNRQWSVAVRPAYPAINQIIRKKIDAQSKIAVDVPLTPFLSSSVQALMTLAAQPPLNLQEQLNELLHYPYGCLEQTVSTSYPWLFLNDTLLAGFKQTGITLAGKTLALTQRTERMNQSIMRLAGMQRSNGSFGLWDNHSDEEYWLTAYAGDFLLDAREQGFDVPDALLDRVLKRLLTYVNRDGAIRDIDYSADIEHSRFAYKAYAAYVLSRVNRAPLGSLRTLYDHYRNASQSGLPLLHLGLALNRQGDTKRGLQALTQALTINRKEDLYLADYGSPLRDLSAMIYLLNKHAVAAIDSEALLYQVSDQLGRRQYLSTQERNALFLAALELGKGRHDNWQATVLLDQNPQKLKQTAPFQSVFEGNDIPHQITVHSDYEKALFLQMRLQGYPKQPPGEDKTLFVTQRHYYSPEGRPVDLAQVTVGDLIVTHVQVQAKERISQTLLVDLLPAGFELENQNLANSIQLSEMSVDIDGRAINDLLYDSDISYQEYRDDRYVAALDLAKDELKDLFYLVRAVTPGTYTVPPVYVEDMYRPYLRGIGPVSEPVTIAAP